MFLETRDFEAERTRLLADMVNRIDPELMGWLDNLEDQPRGTVCGDWELITSEGTVYAGKE